MYDSTLAADAVANWTSIGDLPKPLTQAIVAYDQLRWVTVDHQPRFDPTKVTAINAEALVREFAEELSLSVAGSKGRSVLAEAKQIAVETAARAVLHQAGLAVPSLVEALTPKFSEDAATYAEAVANLPEELTSEGILARGASAVAAYQAAKDSYRAIATVETWVSSLTDLPMYLGIEPAGLLKILAPSTRTELLHLIEAQRAAGTDSLQVELGSELLYAAKTGIEFKIQDPRESAALLEELEDQPVVSKTRAMSLDFQHPTNQSK